MTNALTTLGAKLATRFGMDDSPEVLDILKMTVFKTRDAVPTDAQMTALLIVANQYGLNPWTKEIYAYPDKQNGIVPVVGVDGWSRIINEHPAFDGLEFSYSDETVQHKGKACHVWIECLIYRKDRTRPTVVREYFAEVVRSLSYATPWDTHPNRMHRHKTLIQCARIAFGFAGLYDDDEAQRIIEAGAIDAETGEIKPAGPPIPQRRSAQTAAQAPASAPAGEVTDVTYTERPTAPPAPVATQAAGTINSGQVKYLQNKIASLDLAAEAIAKMLTRHGIADLDTTITVEQFDKLKAELLAAA